MTLKEAHFFFPHEDSDNLYDLYEDRLFEYKQFFLSKTPIRKVFEAKLDKLAQMNEAFLILTNSKLEESETFKEENYSFSDEVMIAFRQWESYKSAFKQQLMISVDAQQIKRTVLIFLLVVDAYRLKWETDQVIELEIDTLSKDADPMYVLEAIKEFNQEGGIFFKDILKMNTNSFLLKEMKRLSLLSKKYGDVRNI